MLRKNRALLMTAAVVVYAVATLSAAEHRLPAPGDPSYWPRVGELERLVAADPENLESAAEYRQLLIAGGYFDRSIELFERLAKRRGEGPNLNLSLALAYVDKVPTSGALKKIHLGFGAIDALTKSIDRSPSVLAYYIRGFINLHFNHAFFHRTDKGIADLQQARALTTPNTPRGLAARVWVTLGDAHWRLGDHATAREIWTTAGGMYPGADPEVSVRRSSDADALDRVIARAFDPGARVDTSLNGALR